MRSTRSQRLALAVAACVDVWAVVACSYGVPSVVPTGDAAKDGPDGSARVNEGGDAHPTPDGSFVDGGPDATPLGAESGADSGGTVLSDSSGDAPSPPGCSDAGIVFVGTSDAASATALQTFAVPVPAVQEGDLLLAFVSYATAAAPPTLTPPNGWTGVGGQASPGVSTFEDDSLYTGMHVATASEPASYTFTASTATYYVAWMIAYRGVSASTPIDMGAFAASSISSAEQPVNPPMLPAQAGEVVVATFAVHPAGLTGLTLTAPAGLTTRASITDGQARGGYTGDVTATAAQTVGPFQIDSPVPMDPTRATVLAELFSLRGCHE